jgi:hypothetical protein
LPEKAKPAPIPGAVEPEVLPLAAIEDYAADEEFVDGYEEGELELELAALLDEAYVDLASGVDHAALDQNDHEDDFGEKRGQADAVFAYAGGTISYYVNKRDFEAVCRQHKDGKRRCVVTRQSTSYARSSSDTRTPTGGRPLGLLCAWLEAGPCCGYRFVHCEQTSVLEEDYDARLAARLRAMTVPGYDAIARHERHALHDGELLNEPLDVRP